LTGWVKRCVEKSCRLWYENNRPQVAIARDSNIYGEEFSGTGECWLATQILSGRRHLHDLANAWFDNRDWWKK
jgi:hypothetical protein